MARRVRLDPGLGLGVRINETELELLRLLSGERGEGSSVLGIDEMGRRIGKSKATIRRSLRMLEEKGLVATMHRYLANGGQLENEYEVTPRGRVAIDAAARAGGDA